MPRQKRFNIIYMIGVGFNRGDKWYYKSFVCNKPTRDEEFRIMNDFVDFLDDFNKPRLFYWHAEKTFWNKAAENHFDRITDKKSRNSIIYNWSIDNWIDLSKIFKDEPIAIKGVFNYGLKSIAKQMKKYGMIQTCFESECKNGMMAMVKVWNCYNNTKDPINSPIMRDIVKYNEFDCRVLYDIIKYIRNNHS